MAPGTRDSPAGRAGRRRAGWHLGRALAGCALAMAAAAGAGTLPAYPDEAAFREAMTRWRTEAARRHAGRMHDLGLGDSPAGAMGMPALPGGAGSAGGAHGSGVEAGDLARVVGDHLVILRRGWLMSVRLDGDRLGPVRRVAAAAPQAGPEMAWHDALLAIGRTVVVIGHSPSRGGTEIGLFDLAADGGLHHRATHHLRSRDAYDPRGPAARQVGSRLVFHAEQPLGGAGPMPWDLLPAMRPDGGFMPRADPGPAEPAASADAPLPEGFRRILPARRIHRLSDTPDPAAPLVLHAVTVCELAAQPVECRATGVLGPPARMHQVSATAVHLWTMPAPVSLVRVPLDGSAPTSIRVSGEPVEASAMDESGDGHLNVLVRLDEEAAAAAKGAPSPWVRAMMPRASGPLGLLRVPIPALGDGRAEAPAAWYRALPVTRQPFVRGLPVGDWMLWAASGGALQAMRPSGAGSAVSAHAGHAIDRILAIGRHAVAVGSDTMGLRLTSLRLTGSAMSAAGSLGLAGVRPAELQAQAHAYQADPAGGDGDGVLGMTTRVGDRPAVTFLARRGHALTGLGTLQASRPEAPPDAGCHPACLDWHGSARPILIGPRLLALIGDELVEARLADTPDGGPPALLERRRLRLAPAPDGEQDVSPR